MVFGWRNDGPNNCENDEGSNGVIESDLVVDERNEIPNQNSNEIQVVAPLKNILTKEVKGSPIVFALNLR